MSVLQMSKSVDSAELARVEEYTPLRHFKVRNDDEVTPARIVFNVAHDSLYCDSCKSSDNCTHTSRVRLCGILTHTVTKRAGIMKVERAK
jgi:hypothetical protein